MLQNGGGQHLSSEAVFCFDLDCTEEKNSDPLITWMRENIQLHDTFILFLCGTATMNSTALSLLEPSNGSTRKQKRKRKIHPERALQILDGHPGIMELIGEYVGVIRGKEFWMLQEFNELVIKYFRTDNSRSSDDDHNDNGEDQDQDEE